jgi:hypothetical protein
MDVGLLPEGLLHCNTAEPPEDVRNIVVPLVDIPVSLRVAVAIRLPLGFFVISGVPINCRLAANTRDGLVITANARNVNTVDIVIL